jgi:transcriptional regulator GlxA family with amidase domain
LNGKKCSTHWAHITEFREKYPLIEVEDGAVITEHDNIYSSGGASSLWNLILYLVEKFSDRETAVMISKYFALDIGSDSQSQFAIFQGQKTMAMPAFKRYRLTSKRNYEDKITIEDLVNLINVGP